MSLFKRTHEQQAGDFGDSYFLNMLISSDASTAAEMRKINIQTRSGYMSRNEIF
jgi:hypothetical protein